MGNSSLKRAQVIIEMVLAFIAIIVLVLGVVRIWAWFNNDMAERQPPFDKSRLAAGSNAPGIWPPPDYGRRPLTEEWVFFEQVPAPVPVTPGTGDGGDRPVDPYACLEAVNLLEEQATRLFNTADNLNNEADRQETRAGNLAERLDDMDPYEELAEQAQIDYDNCVAGCYSDPDCLATCQSYADLIPYYNQMSTNVKNSERYRRLRMQMDAATQSAETLRAQAEEITEQAEQKQAEADNLRARC